jgi:hypothetical protein
MPVLRLSLWSLADGDVTIDELRAQEPPPTPGAMFETWFSDEATERWGSIAIFPDADSAGGPASDLLRELLQKEPDVVELFDVESDS